MKVSNIFYSIILGIFLLIGFIFKEEFFYISLYDNYYVISYFTIAIFISIIILFIYLFKLIIKNRKR